MQARTKLTQFSDKIIALVLLVKDNTVLQQFENLAGHVLFMSSVNTTVRAQMLAKFKSLKHDIRVMDLTCKTLPITAWVYSAFLL